MELAIGGQDANRLVFEPREKTDQEVMGIGGEDHGLRVGQSQFGRDVFLRLRHHIAEDQVPFAVRKMVGLDPGTHLPVERGIRPQMVAVRGKMQPLRIQTQRAREEGFVGHGQLSISSCAGHAPFITRATQTGSWKFVRGPKRPMCRGNREAKRLVRG